MAKTRSFARVISLSRGSATNMLQRLLNNLLVLANLPAALLLGASCLSMYIRPEHLWFLSFLGLVFPLIWVLNLCFFLWFLLRRSKYCLISGVLLLAGYNLPGRFVALGGTPYLSEAASSGLTKTDGNASFSLLSYNVKGHAFRDKKGNPINKSELFKFVETQQPSIACFQEYPSRSSALPEAAIPRLNHRHKGKRNLITATRFPIIKKGEIVFENTGNSCIYSDILVQKDTFRIYNCHLESNRILESEYDVIDDIYLSYNEEQINDLKSVARKMRKAFIVRSGQVDSIANHIRQSPHPVIVCGDFNDTPVSYAYQRIRNSLDDAFIRAGRGYGISFRRRLIAVRIDYTLFCPDTWKAEAYSCPHIVMSDHFPVLTRLTLLK
ncbi:MAG: endonuclease/exonuclease/phosphatase family protein [Bacteroidales bacterium]